MNAWMKYVMTVLAIGFSGNVYAQTLPAGQVADGYKSFSQMALDIAGNAGKTPQTHDTKAPDAISQRGIVAENARVYVDAVQKYYDGAKTYSAAFDQEYETVDGVRKLSSGVVWFKKPGLMRWDYEKPEARFLLSDGQYFWSWEPVYRQYCKQNLGASQLPTALTFLAGEGRLEDDFHIQLGKVDGNQVQLELTPVTPSLSFDKIRFEILMPTAKVFRATIYDAMGNFNRITFKSPEINAAMEDSNFRFTPPADARQICN